MEIFTPNIHSTTSATLESEDQTLFGHLLYHSKDENMKIVQELVEKGFDLSIVRPDSQMDWLRSYKEAHDL